MQNNLKDLTVVIAFCIILILGLMLNLITKDTEISISERRKLAQFPKITSKEVFSGSFSKNFENYVIDQFVARDLFRKIKSEFSTNIFKKLDDNQLFVKDNMIFKMEYPLVEVNILKSAQKMKEVYSQYLKGMNVYYSIIPDKMYYLQDEHLKMNYVKLQKIMEENLDEFTYIDLFSKLDVNDYYKTDIHWKQENIIKIVNEFEKKLNLKETTKDMYQEHLFHNFCGTYYGQVGTHVEPDELKYLTNTKIENSVTYNYETEKNSKVYDIDKFIKSQDKYDIFLSGATPIIKIINPSAIEKKELILFRDSFGSSIAPLFIENYSEITLIDLRYISSTLLGEYIEFTNQDVVFLYSTTVLNQGILK